MRGKSSTFSFEGFFYHLVIDPHLRRVRRRVATRIEPGSSLIDIGCGTGELLISLAGRCSRLAGVEASPNMASYARGRVSALGLRHVDIAYGDGAELASLPDGSFRWSTACMVLHEMEESRRIPVLEEMARVAHGLVLVDFTAPLPRNPTGLAIRMIEFLGGRRHHGNFRSYQRSGGLPSLLRRANLRVDDEVTFQEKCFHLVKVFPVTPATRARSAR